MNLPYVEPDVYIFIEQKGYKIFDCPTCIHIEDSNGNIVSDAYQTLRFMFTNQGRLLVGEQGLTKYLLNSDFVKISRGYREIFQI